MLNVSYCDIKMVRLCACVHVASVCSLPVRLFLWAARRYDDILPKPTFREFGATRYVILITAIILFTFNPEQREKKRRKQLRVDWRCLGHTHTHAHTQKHAVAAIKLTDKLLSLLLFKTTHVLCLSNNNGLLVSVSYCERG